MPAAGLRSPPIEFEDLRVAVSVAQVVFRDVPERLAGPYDMNVVPMLHSLSVGGHAQDPTRADPFSRGERASIEHLASVVQLDNLRVAHGVANVLTCDLPQRVARLDRIALVRRCFSPDR